MATDRLQKRRALYFKLSTDVAYMDNTQLRVLFDENERQQGWGRSQTIELGRSKVFVKRLPLTDTEYDNLFSTSNLFDLPTFYNYGVGSAGFGVFRELVSTIKTTNWVLEGKCINFPMLYHYRIIPLTGDRSDVDMERHTGYVEYWANNQNVGRYMLERAHARYELVLFFEHLPYVLRPWIGRNLDKVDRVLEELWTIIAFLRKNGIVHFDAHFDNILSDGEHIYLADFGLVLDKHFSLSKQEALFLKQNTYYDYGVVLWSIGFLTLRVYNALPEDDKGSIMKKYGIDSGSGFRAVVATLLNNIEDIVADGSMTLPPDYVAAVVKYRGIVAIFDDFYFGMRGNKNKDTKLDQPRLARLLKETGVILDSLSLRQVHPFDARKAR